MNYTELKKSKNKVNIYMAFFFFAFLNLMIAFYFAAQFFAGDNKNEEEVIENGLVVYDREFVLSELDLDDFLSFWLDDKEFKSTHKIMTCDKLFMKIEIKNTPFTFFNHSKQNVNFSYMCKFNGVNYQRDNFDSFSASESSLLINVMKENKELRISYNSKQKLSEYVGSNKQFFSDWYDKESFIRSFFLWLMRFVDDIDVEVKNADKKNKQEVLNYL